MMNKNKDTNELQFVHERLSSQAMIDVYERHRRLGRLFDSDGDETGDDEAFGTSNRFDEVGVVLGIIHIGLR